MKKSSSSTDSPKSSTRRIQVRKSGVHGKGVFALQDIAKGDTVIEYVGEIISAQEAEDRHPHDPKDPNHTFYFQIDEDRVIDALHGGNSARWINHCCSPNCKPEVIDGRVFIKAKKNIPAGAELNYDYGLIIDEPITKALIAQYPCWCGSLKCRQTLLAQKPASRKKQTKKNKEKADEIRKTIKKLRSKLKRLTAD
jgi:SET domain-containing protein